MTGSSISHYELLEKLGGGRSGDLFLARDRRDGRRLALRVLRRELTHDPARVRRFERLAASVAALSHPGIAAVQSVESAPLEDEGRREVVLLTSELVAGDSLDLLVPEGGLPTPRLLDLALPLAEAVAAAHGVGVTHGALEPSVVLVTADGGVKVLDFGLADLARSAAPPQQDGLAGALPGLAAYRAPERARGEPAGPRADVYSLGRILAELATGERSAGEAALAALPPPLRALIGRCLEASPERRFPSARELHAALRELDSELGPVRAAGAGTAAVAAAGVRERLRRWWPLAVLAVAGLAVVLGWLFRRGPGAAGDAPPPAAAGRAPTVVVLPFAELEAPEADGLGGGLAEELGRRLALVSELRTISPRSAALYPSSEVSPAEAARELEADYVLAGTLSWTERDDGSSRVEIRPRLTRAADGEELWLQSFEGSQEGIFIAQAAIALQVLQWMGLDTPDFERRALREPPTATLEAYRDYLGASHRAHLDEPEALREAVRLLQRALEVDPRFALAWARLSRVYSSPQWPPEEQRQRLGLAEEAARAALAIDPELPQGHLALGWQRLRAGEYEAASASLGAAARGLPNDPEVMRALAAVWRREGRFEEALGQLQAAMRLDPGNAALAGELGDTLLRLRRYPEAAERLRRSISLAPGDEASHGSLAKTLLAWKADLAGARAALEAVAEPRGPATRLELVRLAVLGGDYETALGLVSEAGAWFAPGDPAYTPRSLWQGWIYELKGLEGDSARAYQEARDELEALAAERPEDPWVRGSLGWAHAARGLRGAAVREGLRATQLLSLSEDAVGGVWPVEMLARIYLTVGDHEAAISELSLLLSVPSELSAPLLRLDPTWAPLRAHPRFRELLEFHG